MWSLSRLRRLLVCLLFCFRLRQAERRMWRILRRVRTCRRRRRQKKGVRSMNAPHLVIVDTFAPLNISAGAARSLWAARVCARRRAGYIWASLNWLTDDGRTVREYAAIRLGPGPNLLYLEGMPRKFRVRWSSWQGSGCVGTFDDFGRAFACLVDQARRYERAAGE